MSLRKTWEYCDIPICGMYGVTRCHPARHGNTATFLYVVSMVLHYVTPQDMEILRHSYMWYVWCYTLSPRKTWKYYDIPICGEYGVTLCHPARHGNTATFLYVVCMVLHSVTPQDMEILRHSYMWYVWCYTMSPRKTWEYCDIPICGKEQKQCHPARHWNTATFLYMVRIKNSVTPQDMGILRHSYMW